MSVTVVLQLQAALARKSLRSIFQNDEFDFSELLAERILSPEATFLVYYSCVKVLNTK